VKYELLKERYDAVKKALEIEKYKDFFSSYPFNSGYFMCVQLKRGIDGEKVRQLLLDKYNSGVINMNNIIRIAFSAVAKDNIPQLFENIYNACKEVAG
jgi:DNA-binding transcriptional MocR family regulator